MNARKFFDSKKHLISEEMYKDAMNILEEIERKEAAVLKESEQFKEMGNEAFKNGNMEEALKLYTQAINANPANYLVYSNRALVYSKLGRDEECIKDCLDGIAINSNFVKFYIRLASVYLKSDRKKSMEYVKKGLEVEPNNEALLDLKESLIEDDETLEGMPDSAMFNTANISEMLKNPNLQNMVKNFVKDKSPEELKNMMQDVMKNFRK